MDSEKPGKVLLSTINQRFIEEVGPVGDLLIEDAFNLWRSKQWRGPAAFRHYIKSLANNIENNILRDRFLKDSERYLYQAQRKQSAN